MATAQQISTRALKRLGVVPAGATAAAADVTDATDELNSMIASWEADGLSGDVLPLDARFEQAIVDMLVVRIAPQFGVAITPDMRVDRDRGWSQIQSAFFAVPKTRFDSALTHSGCYSDHGVILGQTNDSYADWEESTAYELRQCVVNEANIYECIEAGTSASSVGPTGTAPEIVDGSAIWCWRRVAG